MHQQLSQPVRTLAQRLVWGFILLILLLTSFTFISLQLHSDWLGAFDTNMTAFVQSFSNPAADGWARFMDRFGSGYGQAAVFLIAAIILVFRLKHYWETVLLLVSLLGGAISNSLIKGVFERARPDIVHLVYANGYSFPSGHSMVSASFFGMLGYVVWINLRDRRKAAWYVPILTILLIVSIGASRVYAGVHFPSDVLAGFIGGGVWVVICAMGLQAVRHYRSSPN